MFGNRIIAHYFVLIMIVVCCGLFVPKASAEVSWDPIDGSTDFEDELNWDAETYDPPPSGGAGDEVAPPGSNSNFSIGGGNHIVILDEERSGLMGTTKLGTFTIGTGTHVADDPETEEEETVGPGDEISTLIIRNHVTFTSQERAADGNVQTRPVRVGHQDEQPEVRFNGELDMPWGIVLHEAGTFTVEATTDTNDQIRLGSSEDYQGGSIFEISGTGRLNVVADKVRVGDRRDAKSSGNSVFRIRGSTMGTSKTDPAIRIGQPTATNVANANADFEIESTSGFWDVDRPVEYEQRRRYNRGKGILEFVLDENGVTPLFVADTIKIGDNDVVNVFETAGDPTATDEDTDQYGNAFLRIKLSRPLTATTPGMAGQSPLTLIWADTISTQIPTVANPPTPEEAPLFAEYEAGRFFDPDRDGPAVFPFVGDPDLPDIAPHRMLQNGGQVISDYAGATYTWTIEYFEDGAPVGADNNVQDSYVRLVNGALSGLLGDLNDDTLLNEDDRTELINAIASPPDRHQLLGQAQHLFDLNADDMVDELDLAVFNTYILAPPFITGDHNKDGVVDVADFVMWSKTDSGNSQGYTDWSTHFGEGDSGTGNSAVPEPTSVVLLLAALCRITLRRHR
jgi:hypothetical protein